MNAGVMAAAPALDADMLIVFTVLVVVFVAFVRSVRSPDVVAMLGAGALLVSGVITVEDLLDVFSNPGPVTVGALFIVSGALRRTGVVERLHTGLGALTDLGATRARLVMLAIVMAISAIINNTPVVMVLTPLVISLASKLDTVPSKLLIPLSYASILGGACTIIGTSTNLIIDGVAQKNGLEAFGIFEITLPGIVIGVVGITYLMIVGPWLLPERRPTFEIGDDQKARRDFVTELVVSEDAELAGEKLGDTEVWDRDDVRVLDVLRDDEDLEIGPELELAEGDRVLIRSNAENILDLRALVDPDFGEEENEGSVRDAVLVAGFRPTAHRESKVMEGIVGPDSQLVGKRVADLNLRRSHDISILAMHRQGESLEDFESAQLRFGDTLLLESNEKNLRDLFTQQDLVNLSEPEVRTYRRRRAPIALLTVVLIVALAAFQVMPIAGLAIIGAAAVMAFRCIEPDEAYRVIDWRILFLIFGMLGIGKAMQTTGAAALIVHQLVSVMAPLGPWWVLAVIYAASSALTETITNNAVAVLVTPLVIGIAEQMGVDARGFVVAVMFAASASFATPLGYQTNTIVYGAGNYRFRDFLRIGLPLNIIVGIVAVLLIPFFWPFDG